MCAIYFRKNVFAPSLTLYSLKYLKGFKSIAQSIYKKLYVHKQKERAGFSAILA